MTAIIQPIPRTDEPELTLIGPGYGESILLHVGGGIWVIIDSCIDDRRMPCALSYLHRIGVNPSQAVRLIVASHWHDDHIRGMADLVKSCDQAKFCCAATLRDKEFLASVDALQRRHLTVIGSGAREIHDVFAVLAERKSEPQYVVANRILFQHGNSEIRSLSPHDGVFQAFLQSVGQLLPGRGETKGRIPSLYPNEIAVVLWVRIGESEILLGSDLEVGGWKAILQSPVRPQGAASIFKIPHHGSQNAHEPDVWKHMLAHEPFAILTPWSRGSGVLPTQGDVQRIRSCTLNAYTTKKSTRGRSKRRRNEIERSVRESSINLRRSVVMPGIIRLRQKIDSKNEWDIDLLDGACRL